MLFPRLEILLLLLGIPASLAFGQVPEELVVQADPAVALIQTSATGPNVLAGGTTVNSGQLIANAFDFKTATKHFNNTGSQTSGFVVTPSIGGSVLKQIRFATGNDSPGRDPLTVVIQGSNATDALAAGTSSFTTIYQGVSGLAIDPGRQAWGDPVSFTNTVNYKSYRVIVTKTRGGTNGAQYSEATLLGIPTVSRRDAALQHIKMSFRPLSEPVPEGFLTDNGLDYIASGPPSWNFAYGWAPTTPRKIYRKSLNDHPLLASGVQFTTADSKWEMALANGLYEVTVCVGSPDDEHDRLPLLVEGMPYFSGLQVGKNAYLKKSRTVSIADGRLTLNLDAAGLGSDWLTKGRFVCVSFLEIKPVAQATADRMVVWSVDSTVAVDREFYGLVPNIVSTSKPTTNPLNTLWYDRPAKIWEEGAMLGNGRLGAVLDGNPVREVLQLNEDTLWNLSPGLPFANPDGKFHIDAARGKIFENKPQTEIWNYIYDNVFKRADGQYGPFMADYLNGGDLVMNFPDGAFDNYYRALDLSDGIASTRYSRGGVQYTREAFSSAVDNVLVVRLTANTPASLSFTTEARDSYGAVKSTSGNDTLLVDGQAPAKNGIPGAIRYQRRVKFLADSGTISASNGRISVSGANSVTMLVSIRTNFIKYNDLTGDPVARSTQDITLAAAKTYASLRAAHVADHRALYDRMSIDLGAATTIDLPTNERIRRFQQSNDPQMAALVFQFGRYLMMGCSRPGSQAANLQGIWNPWYTGAWGGKYTVNINIQMNYWLPEPANLAECHQPFMDLIKKTAAVGTATAESYYGARGWVVHHNADIWGNGHPIDGTAGMWPMASAWFCDHIWERYLYSKDENFLREMYPELRDAATFYLDSLVLDPRSGHLVTAPSMSPENGPICSAPTMDVQLLQSLFTKAKAAAEILGEDVALRAQWESARSQLPPMQIGGWGQLQEWTHADLDDPNNKHRHVSHLYGLHPGNLISQRKTPALYEAAKVSLLARGDEATGWSLGWKTNFWARFHDGNHAYDILKLLIKPSFNSTTYRWGSGLYPNFFDAHPPFQIDGNFGAAAGILEMLVQSQEGEIEVLPALPSAWPDGRVNGMRVRGGFEVDLEWRGGKPTLLRLKSKGGTLCTVRYGEQLIPVQMADGATREIVFDPDGYSIVSKQDDVIPLKQTVKGLPNVIAVAGDFGGSGSSELVGGVRDGNLATKYFNKAIHGSLPGGINSGFVIKPKLGATVVNAFQLATANDIPGRDPLTITIEGSNAPDADSSGGNGYQLLYQGGSGVTSASPRQTWAQVVNFSNVTAYRCYRILVTSAVGGSTANAVQYSEVQLSGKPVAPLSEQNIISNADAAVALKQTTAAGVNVLAVSGTDHSAGEGADKTKDQNLNTKYYNKSKNGELPTGVDSGFAITPAAGPMAVVGFQIATGNDMPGRDPKTIIIQGSNAANALQAGGGGFVTVWQGPAGLNGDPGRKAWGQPVAFWNPSTYTTYRVLIQETRIANSGAQYSEVRLFAGGSQASQSLAVEGKTLPEAWREQYFGHGSLTRDTAADSDFDGDGQNTWSEFLAGTSPVSASSVFRIRSMKQAEDGVTISFASVKGVTYLIEASADLSDPAAWRVIRENIEGNDEILTIGNLESLSPEKTFYRAKVMQSKAR